MKGYIINWNCYIFPQQAGEIPAVEANAFYVQEEDYAAWVEENEKLADKIKKYNYNIITKLAKGWAGHTDDDLEPPVVLYDITYSGDDTHVTGPATGEAGDTITITPTTAAEFNDITLTSSDATITKNAENWTFTMPEADVAIGVVYNVNHISKSGNIITLTLVNTEQFIDPLIAELVDEQAPFGYCSQIIYDNNTALDYYIQKGGTTTFDEYRFRLTANDAVLFRVYKQHAGPVYRIDNINSTYLNIYTCEPVPATIPINITGSEYISGTIPTEVGNYTITNIQCTTNVLATYTGGDVFVGGSTIQLKTSINKPDVLGVNLIIEDANYSTKHLTFRALEDTTFTFSTNDLQYSTDNGTTWSTLPKNTATPTVTAGNKILWKQTGLIPDNNAGIGTFSATGNFDALGNIMSLYYGDNFIGQTDLTGKNNAFHNLFNGNTMLDSAENLVLPATTLTDYCYSNMFSGCTTLTTAPELPATTLADSCYSDMFYGCTELRTAPELPATTLANSCYESMFSSCTSLGYIKCLATNIGNNTYNWVRNVAEYGTFVKDPSMTDWTTDENGIPSGWTVEDAPA